MINRHLSYISQTINYNASFKNIIVSIIFLIFLFSCSIQLGSVPGLVGDEGDEGQNITELTSQTKPPLMGERSYIGAWIDYARMPLFFTFGFNALSLRLLTLFVSIAFFWFGYFALTRLFGEIGGLMGLVAVSFSPIYFTQQRISWAITLLPFFAIIVIYLFQKNKRWSPLIVGVAAGLGANTHLLFMATLAGLVIAGIPFLLQSVIRNFTKQRLTKLLTSILLAAIGFWAAFGMQYVNLVLYKGDQGNIEKITSHFYARLSELPTLAPKFISGSVYMSSFTAQVFPPVFDIAITSILIAVIISGVLFSRKRWLLLTWVLGLSVHLITLSYMIEYYAIRYFIIASLSFWILAGLTLGSYFNKDKLKKSGYVLALVIAILLTAFNFKNVIFQFDSTGGSTDNFSINDSQYDSASAFVDINPLLACIADKNNIFSNNIHIRNRLIFLTNGNKNINIATQKKDVRWLIKYRMPNDRIQPTEVCPSLTHFIVEPVYDSRNVEWPQD